MLDNFNNTIPIVHSPYVDFEDLSSKYDALLSIYSVRTNNVLSALQQNYASKRDFLEYFIQMSRKKIAGLRNCGRKTIKEIEAIQNCLTNSRVIFNPGETEIASLNDFEKPDSTPFTPPSNTDTLLPLIMPRLEHLSVRAKNGFLIFLKENNDSLTEVYAAITDPNFNPLKMKNVGRNTAEEIMGLLNGIKELLEGFPDEQSVEAAVTGFFTKTLNDLHVPAESQEEIYNLENTLGYFPLFATVKAFIEGMDDESRAIAYGCIRMHEGQELEDREVVSNSLGITGERVRQKRNKLIERMEGYFTCIRTLGFVDKCPYTYQMTRVNEMINATEGTDFNLNFVNWVLGTTFEEVTLLGDVLKTLSAYYEKDYFLCLVPTDLCQYMDFNAFIEDINTRLAEKRINEEKVNLQGLINAHLKTQYCEDEMPAIETACRSILYLHYPVEVDFGQVIFKQNARKNNPIIVEEILRAAGHPLTLQELYDEFIYQYPERYTELYSFRGSVNANPNIIPIGRTSTYTLAEWESDEHKGGTIRQIVCDYLDSIEGQIATAEEIVDYVRRFRPESSDSSISSNLMQEQNHKFSAFEKDGIRYFGYTTTEYDPSFKRISGENFRKRTIAMSMRVLEKFVLTNGHFPFWGSDNEEECRLYRFVANRRTAYTKGTLTEIAAEQWRAFEEKYRKYDIPHFRNHRSKYRLGDTTDVQDNLG